VPSVYNTGLSWALDWQAYLGTSSLPLSPAWGEKECGSRGSTIHLLRGTFLCLECKLYALEGLHLAGWDAIASERENESSTEAASTHLQTEHCGEAAEWRKRFRRPQKAGQPGGGGRQPTGGWQQG